MAVAGRVATMIDIAGIVGIALFFWILSRLLKRFRSSETKAQWLDRQW
jgi:hypothetical protein